METFFYVIAIGGSVVSILLLATGIAMMWDFGEPIWKIFGKSGNR